MLNNEKGFGILSTDKGRKKKLSSLKGDSSKEREEEKYFFTIKKLFSWNFQAVEKGK